MKIFATLLLAATTAFGTPYLWVTDDAAPGHVNVIDVDTTPPSIVQTITLPISEPTGIAFTPDGSYCYVVGESSGAVVAIKTSNYTVVTPTPIAVGSSPYFLTIPPSGEYVYVANYSSSSISVISTATNQVVQTLTSSNIAGLNSPYQIAASPNGEYIYIGNYGANNILVISTANNQLVTTISGGNFSDIYCISFAPNGTAYVSNAGNDYVTVISPTFAVSSVLSSDFNDSYYNVTSPSGNTVYTANSSAPYIGALNTSNNTASAVSDPNSYLTFAYSLAIAPEGNYLYSLSAAGSNLVLINTTTNTAIAKYTLAVADLYYGAFQPSASTLRPFQRPSNRRS